MEFAEMNYYKCKTEDEENAAFLDLASGALWARIAQNVKKLPLTVNVIDFEFFDFNVSIWVPWSPLSQKVMIHWIGRTTYTFRFTRCILLYF